MILKIIKNNTWLRQQYIQTLSRFWVKEKVSRFLPWVPSGSTAVDIGAGNGLVAFELKNTGILATAVDVANLSILPEIPVTVYDGEKLPYENNHFDNALLLTVLHHTTDPVAVLKESARVAKQVVIIEDVYKNVLQKYLTFAMDTLVNFGHSEMTYQNRSLKEWKQIFKALDLEIIAEKQKRVLLFFRQATFILKTKNDKI
jgi:Methylase involved in ubiquinone/menaquinone biosynthesis